MYDEDIDERKEEEGDRKTKRGERRKERRTNTSRAAVLTNNCVSAVCVSVRPEAPPAT
jgi:hypothetical protein